MAVVLNSKTIKILSEFDQEQVRDMFYFQKLISEQKNSSIKNGKEKAQ